MFGDGSRQIQTMVPPNPSVGRIPRDARIREPWRRSISIGLGAWAVSLCAALACAEGDVAQTASELGGVVDANADAPEEARDAGHDGEKTGEDKLDEGADAAWRPEDDASDPGRKDEQPGSSSEGPMNGPNCPGDVPQVGASCSQIALCDYGELACFCDLDGRWRCEPSGPTETGADNPELCPEALPDGHEGCADKGLTCSYERAGMCVCLGREGWSCLLPDDMAEVTDAGGSERCPQQLPSGTCVDGGITCQYPQANCICFGEWYCR